MRSVTALGLRAVELREVEGMRELGVRWATTLELLDCGAATVVPDLLTDCGALYVFGAGHSRNATARRLSRLRAC